MQWINYITQTQYDHSSQKKKKKNSMYSRQSDKSLMCAPTPIGFRLVEDLKLLVINLWPKLKGFSI